VSDVYANDRIPRPAQPAHAQVDVGREVISAAFSAKVPELQAAVTANSSAAVVKKIGDALLAIIDDYDALLSTDTNFMLGRCSFCAIVCTFLRDLFDIKKFGFFSKVV
jgi:hypothetical protein